MSDCIFVVGDTLFDVVLVIYNCKFDFYFKHLNRHFKSTKWLIVVQS